MSDSSDLPEPIVSMDDVEECSVSFPEPKMDVAASEVPLMYEGAVGGEETSQQSQAKATTKQLSVSEFIDNLENYPSTIPDAVTAQYMHSAGISAADPRIVRIVSLAAQKFVSDLASDALQHCKMRGAAQNTKSPKGKDKRFVLTHEDLMPALAGYGIQIKKPPYHT